MTRYKVERSDIVTFKDGRRIPRQYEEYIDDRYIGLIFVDADSFVFVEKYKKFLISVGLSYVNEEVKYLHHLY